MSDSSCLLAGAAWELGEVLFIAELEHGSGRIPDVILMAAESVRGGDLGHHILDLNRLDGNATAQIIVKTAAGRKGERVLRLGEPVDRSIPHVGSAEQELRIRIQTRLPPVKPGAEHIGQQLFVDAL